MWRCPKCGYSPELEKLQKTHNDIIESVKEFDKFLESCANDNSQEYEIIQEGVRTAIVPKQDNTILNSTNEEESEK